MTFPPSDQDTADSSLLLSSYRALRTTLQQRSSPPLPSPSALSHAISSLPTPSSPSYLSPHGTPNTLRHILTDLTPGLNNQALSSRYYGFVTGGVHPAAEGADNIATALDQNVQVHVAGHSASGDIEDAALGMVISLLELGQPKDWPGKVFTTGATAGNIMGLACGRDAVLNRRLCLEKGESVGEMGLLKACLAAGVAEVQVLTSMGHSSLAKAASVAGLGRGAVKELGVSAEEPWRLDLDAVERELAREGVANVIVVSAGEVNTGRFATGALDMPKLRSLADRYGAWIHVDGAFGIFARALPRTDEFLYLHANVAGLELADSIGTDGHKILNVPYDTGVFLCRDVSVVKSVFQNPNAAYLATRASDSDTAIHSALNIGIENSRRFRALPVYAVSLSEGRPGISAMVVRMVRLARQIASFIRDSEHYEWLPDPEASLELSFMIVLFRARDPALNEVLADRINASNKIFVSGTRWAGQKAVRIAVSSWRVDVDADLAVVQEVLTSVAEGWS